jgi:hypothetical protein
LAILSRYQVPGNCQEGGITSRLPRGCLTTENVTRPKDARGQSSEQMLCVCLVFLSAFFLRSSDGASVTRRFPLPTRFPFPTQCQKIPNIQVLHPGILYAGIRSGPSLLPPYFACSSVFKACLTCRKRKLVWYQSFSPSCSPHISSSEM